MLRNQPGIHSVKVALLAERAVVEYDPKQWTEEKIMSVSTTIYQMPHRALVVHTVFRTIVPSLAVPSRREKATRIIFSSPRRVYKVCQSCVRHLM